MDNLELCRKLIFRVLGWADRDLTRRVVTRPGGKLAGWSRTRHDPTTWCDMTSAHTTEEPGHATTPWARQTEFSFATKKQCSEKKKNYFFYVCLEC